MPKNFDLSSNLMPCVVSVDWLAAHIKQPDLIILDASIAKVGQAKLLASTSDIAIPGALFFDLKGSFSDQAAKYPNTCPSAEQFQREAQALGVNQSSRIVIYDRHGIYSAARAWYLFRAFGHQAVSVLDGGLPAWIAAGQSTGRLKFMSETQGDFKAHFDENYFVNAKQVRLALEDPEAVIIDARSSGRFNAKVAEPRPEVRGGSIPGSNNLHYASLFANGLLRSDAELSAALTRTNHRNRIFSCGSGVTACVLALAAKKIGLSSFSVYDGSWTEWGSCSELPIQRNNNSMKTILQGALRVPGDKSITQRAYIFSAMAEGISRIHYPLKAADADSCLQAVCDLGAELIERNENTVVLKGVGTSGFQTKDKQVIECGNSGTAMRLLTGAISGQNVIVSLIGDDSLNQRPMERVAKPMRAMGSNIETTEGTPPIKIYGGGLRGAEYVSPVASAQVKSCVILAGLQAEGQTTLIEPQRSRDHTEKMLPEFGVQLETLTTDTDYRVMIQGGQALTATEINVPADPSSAAFILVAASLLKGSEVTLTDVCMNPGRTGIILALRRMGADIELKNTRLFGQEPVSDLLVRASELKAIDIKAEQVVDMVDEIPLLMLAAAYAEGDSHFEGLRELRVKESDRLALMIDNLKAIGVDCEMTENDGAIIRGIDSSNIESADWQVQHDHRLAMTGYVAQLVSDCDVQIADMDAASVSWPSFINDIESLKYL